MKQQTIGIMSVDFDNDFMGQDDGTAYTLVDVDGILRTAALAVKGGLSAAKKAARFIEREAKRIARIWASMDNHPFNQLAHPHMWVDQDGNRPANYTQIRREQVLDGTWSLGFGGALFRGLVLEYLEKLEATSGMYLRIWPAHCVEGTWGQLHQADVARALLTWEKVHGLQVDIVLKGMAVIEEHYGAVEAQVQNPAIPSTMPNHGLLAGLSKCDVLIVVGVATDYCLRRTVEQIIKYLGVEFAKRIVIFTDCIAGIDPGESERFLGEMRSLGATITTSDAYQIPS